MGRKPFNEETCMVVLALNRCCHRGVVIHLDGGGLETEDPWKVERSCSV